MMEVIRSAVYQLLPVSHLWSFLGRKELATVVHTLIRYRSDYGNTLYVSLPLKGVQNFKCCTQDIDCSGLYRPYHSSLGPSKAPDLCPGPIQSTGVDI